MSNNSKILNHPAYDESVVAKCRAGGFTTSATLDILDAIQEDQARAKAAQQSDNTKNAMLAAKSVGERLGSRKAIQRAQNG